MKNLIFGGLLLCLVGFCYVSCNKTDFVSENHSNVGEKEFTKPNTSNSINKANGPIVILRCDQRRKKFDCNSGWGICNCEWFPDAPWNQISTQIDSGDSTMTMESSSFRRNGFDTLTIDGDFDLPKDFATSSGYKSVVIGKGKYVKQNDSVVVVNVNLTI